MRYDTLVPTLNTRRFWPGVLIGFLLLGIVTAGIALAWQAPQWGLEAQATAQRNVVWAAAGERIVLASELASRRESLVPATPTVGGSVTGSLIGAHAALRIPDATGQVEITIPKGWTSEYHPSGATLVAESPEADPLVVQVRQARGQITEVTEALAGTQVTPIEVEQSASQQMVRSARGLVAVLRQGSQELVVRWTRTDPEAVRIFVEFVNTIDWR